MNSQRIAGLEKEMARVVSRLFMEEVKNKKISGVVSVTKVKLSQDSKRAVIYVSILKLGQELNEEKIKEGFGEVRGFIRKRLAEEIRLRYTPEIELKLDDSIEYGARINKLINDLKIEKSES